MTDCPNGLIRDQLPEYVHGVMPAFEAARVDAHLNGCAECRSEVELLKAARAGLALRTPMVDVASIVAALPAPRLATRTVPRRFVGRHVWQFAAAAALVLVVGSRALFQGGAEGDTLRVADSAGARAIPSVVAVDSPGAVNGSAELDEGITFGGGLSDLSLTDLQALLGQMDSVRTLPSSQPESMTPVIGVKEGDKSL